MHQQCFRPGNATYPRYCQRDTQGADVRILFIASLFLFGLIAPGFAAPDKRVALVIGNNAYKELHVLGNPGADAQSLAKILADSGFDVISCDGKRPGCFDLTREGLSAAIEQLRTKAQDAALAFVFYAGHGMAAPEGNVLAPIDAGIDCERQQLARGVLVDEVMEALAGAKQKIVVLDACRDNPLGEICPPATKARLTFRDFKIPDAGNFLLVSSTKPGQVADDGLAGTHSPFARTLLAALSGTPTVHFDQVFNRVSKTVIEETSKGNFTQIPEMLIRGGAPETCLAGEACAADPQAAALREELAALHRDRARDQELGETAKEYLAQLERQHGKPLSVDERRRELASLKEATRALASRNDNRGERALEKLKSGDTGDAKRLFLEDLDAEQAEEHAEAARRTERRKKTAASARNIAALARWTDVAEAVTYYKRAVDLDPEDAQTWDDYARAAKDAGRTDEAKAAFEQAAQKASGEDAESIRYWALNGQGDIALAQGSLPQALRVYRSAQAAMDRLTKADPGNAGWRRDLSVSYDRAGDVLVAQGALPEALKAFQDSLAIRDRLAKADPGNAVWRSDLSVSYEKVGDVLVEQGKLAEALTSFQDCLAIVDRLAQTDPGVALWQRNLWVSYGKIADVLIAQGDLAGGLSNWQKAHEITSRLAKADPGNAGWQRDLSVSNNKVGDVLVEQGKLAEALTSFQDSLAIADRLAKADPGNAGWQRDLFVSYARVGDVLVAQGKLSEASKSFQDSLAIAERLAKVDPGNATWQRDLNSALRYVADVKTSQGDLNSALADLLRGKELMARLAKADPGNTGWQYELCISNERIGDVQMAQGDLAAALKSFQTSQDIISRLAKADPGNAGWQRELSVSNLKVGDVLVARGKLADALKSFQDSLAIVDRLAKADPGNAGWQRDLSVSYGRVGDVLVEQGNLQGALKAFQDSLAIADRLAKADPGNAGWQRDLSVSNVKVGDVLVARGKLPDALKLFQDSLAIFARLAKADPGNAGWQYSLGVSNGRIGDVQVAQGDLAAALKSFQTKQDIISRLAKADPGNAGWQRDLSVSYDRMGKVLVAQGHLPEALKAFQDSLAINSRLAKADPDNAGWQRDIAMSYERLIPIYIKYGEKEKAAQMLADGRQILLRLTSLSPDNATWKGDLAWFDEEIATLPYQEAKAAVEAAFDANGYAKAAALQAKLAVATETAEREKAGKPGPESANALLVLSWYRLFARDFKGALAASDRAMALEPQKVINATNKAHALMFLGRRKEARALYLHYKGQRIEEVNKLWEEAILDDFKEFEEHGLKHRQMAEIKALFAAK